MSAHRQHIHLICDSSDSSLHALQDAVVMFFENKANITYDLFTATTATANYSWRCVNACDWAIMLVGDSYGQLTNTGVSQLHISYLNAKTKNKPISVLVVPSENRPRQLLDLLAIIQNQNQDIYHIDEDTHIGDLLEALQYMYLPEQDKPAPTIASVSTNTSSRKKSSKDSGVAPKKPAPFLQDEILLSCQAHAFRGGTLIEVGFMAKTTWREVLQTLAGVPSFSSQGLLKLLSELVSVQAMPSVKVMHPDVHAISRCQIAKTDMAWLQKELHEVGWIGKLSNGRDVWQLTDVAKQRISDMLLNL